MRKLGSRQRSVLNQMLDENLVIRRFKHHSNFFAEITLEGVDGDEDVFIGSRLFESLKPFLIETLEYDAFSFSVWRYKLNLTVISDLEKRNNDKT